jgi:hypothetical protein
MKSKFVLAVILFLSLAVAGFAQTPTQHFVISANAAGYDGQKGMTAVSEEGTGFQLTSNVSLAYARISNPTDSKAPVYNLGAVNYTRELGSLLPAKLKKSLVFDTTNWLVTFQAGAGKVTYEGVNRIAELAGLFLARPVAPNMQITCGYQWLHGQGNSLITRSNTGVPVVGLTFTF